MPLDAARLDRTAAITAAFGAIGKLLPKPKNGKDAIAYELYAASLVASLADKRREDAKKAAIDAGVLPDYASDPYPVGTEEVVYSGALVAIMLKVVGQADRVNAGGLVADLTEAGVKPALLKRLLKKHTSTFNGAHIFTASLIK